MVDHIHLDNNTFNILLKEQYALLYYLDSLIVTVYIYIYIYKLI
jgi:hypothetical protein